MKVKLVCGHILPVYMSGVEQLDRCTCVGIQVEVHSYVGYCMRVCMYVWNV